MGAAQSTIGGYDMVELESCTFLTKADIVHIHKVFTALAKKFNKGMLVKSFERRAGLQQF